MRVRLVLTTTLAIAAVVLVGPPALAKYPQTITTSTPFVNLPRPADDPRWAQAFSHWDKRAATEEVMAAIKIFEAIAKDKPNQLESQLWLLRSYMLAGMRNRAMNDRMGYLNKALAAGDKALAIEPGNGFVVYWRYCAIGLMRDLTKEEYAELKTFGARYRDLRELPVPDDDPLWAEAITHWDARIKREEGLAAIKIFETLEKKFPRRVEPKMWLARSNYYMNFLETTKEGKAKWGLAAAEWGRKAIEIEPRNAGANFWTAAGLGRYANNTGVVNMVRYSLEIARCLLVVTEEDPNYYYGGFSNYFASAIARAGALVGKTAEIIGFPPETIERMTVFGSNYEPNYFGNFHSLAEMYIKLGRMDEAKKCLETIINSDPAALKMQEPENRVYQESAKKLIKEHFSK